MLMIKWHTGDGIYRLEEVADDLRFPVNNYGFHEVEVRHEDDGHVTLWAVDCNPEQPWVDSVKLGHPLWDEIEVAVVSERPSGRTFVRPFSWRRPDGARHMLITDAPVFVMNDQGDTVEALR